MDAGTFANSVNTLDVTGAGTIHLGGGTLAFATSSAKAWSGGTLTLTGTFVSGASLRVGTTGSGLTAGQLARISAAGYGNFALNASGYLTASIVSGYASWAATNAPTGTAKDDADGDGVSNGLEYVLGGSKTTNDSGKLPKISTSGGNVLFTFVRAQASIDGATTVAIEVGPDLATWPSAYTVGADTAGSSAGVTIVKDSPTTGFDTVTLTVPQGSGGGKFARLKVSVP